MLAVGGCPLCVLAVGGYPRGVLVVGGCPSGEMLNMPLTELLLDCELSGSFLGYYLAAQPLTDSQRYRGIKSCYYIHILIFLSC